MTLIGQIEQPLCKYARAIQCGDFVDVGKDGFKKEPTIFNKLINVEDKNRLNVKNE